MAAWSRPRIRGSTVHRSRRRKRPGPGPFFPSCWRRLSSRRAAGSSIMPASAN